LNLVSPSALALEKPYQLQYISPNTCIIDDTPAQCLTKLQEKFTTLHSNSLIDNSNNFCIESSHSDSCINPSVDIEHFIVDRFGNHYVVVELWNNGGETEWTVLLISKQSEVLARLTSFPVASPAGNYFVTAWFDIDAGYKPNVIEIWSTDQLDKPAFIWQKFPDGYGPFSVFWGEDDSLNVNLTNLDGHKKKLKLRFNEEQENWEIDEN